MSQARWYICLDDGVYSEDEMVGCSGWLVTVHQNWYRRGLAEKIPEDDWYCERCREVMSGNVELDHAFCIFCPDKQGLLVKYNGHKDIWAHVNCIEWMPELDFLDDE